MSALRLSLAQINPTVGDIAGNVALMSAAAQNAAVDGASAADYQRAAGTSWLRPSALRFTMLGASACTSP